MGSQRSTPAGPFVAGSYAELTLVYTAGTFGIDDTGMLKMSWRTTSDMASRSSTIQRRQTTPRSRPATAPNSKSGSTASISARMPTRCLIRVGRGYLRAGDTMTIVSAIAGKGSPGFRLQTNVENKVELKTASMPLRPTSSRTAGAAGFELVPGPAASWKAIVPSLAVVGEPFRLAIVAEDMWGNPTGRATARLEPESIAAAARSAGRRRDQAGRRPHVIEASAPRRRAISS